MMKRIKTLTAWVLALALLVSVMPLGVLAQVLRETSPSIRLVDSMVPVENIATVQIYNEDGDVVQSTQYLIKGQDKIIRPATPTKTNWKFEGWYTAPAGSGTLWNFDTVVTENVNLYPFFKELRYVFFQDDTGYVSGEQSRVVLTKQGVAGETFTTGDVSFPMSSLHSIEGWYDEPNPGFNQPPVGNKVLTGNFSSIGQGGLTLYPRIVTGNYLSFATGQGASYLKPQFVPGGANPVEPTAEEQPTRPGYTTLTAVFAHITLEKTASPTTYTAAGQQITYTYTVTNDGDVGLNQTITITDDKLPGATIQITTGLGKGETKTVTATYTITEAEMAVGSVTNTASAKTPREYRGYL